MTAEHLRPLLDNAHDTGRFWRLSGDLARAFVPEEIVNVIRLGRLTASKSHLETFGASCAATSSVALSRRPLQSSSQRWFRGPRRHFNTRCPRRQALSASHMLLWLSRIWTNAPLCYRSMASALWTSFLVCRCWKACVPLKMVIRSFRLCCSSTATHLLSFGRALVPVLRIKARELLPSRCPSFGF